MKSVIQIFSKYQGTFEGTGNNHEGQTFRGTFVAKSLFKDKGVAIQFTATGADGTIYHEEQSVLSLTSHEAPALWVLSNNHPANTEHTFCETPTTPGAEMTFAFKYGDLEDPRQFREIITLDFWANGDLSYRYSWGLPGSDLKERSSVRMVPGKNRPISKAVVKKAQIGLAPEGPGWYVINAKETQWKSNERFGDFCNFEGNVRFEQYGINLHVIYPDQPSCYYHGEDDQENFLVVEGECKLLIENEEIELKKWDFVHCPKWTRHVFVGAGNKPCALVMVGGRTGRGVIYPTPELAKRYNACPDHETDSPREYYSKFTDSIDIKSPWPLR